MENGRAVSMMPNGKPCSDCRKKDYCKKQCRENKIFFESEVRQKIIELMAKRLKHIEEEKNDGKID